MEYDDVQEIKADVKTIARDVGDIKVTMATNTAHLAEHMVRTHLNESRIEKLEYWLLGILGSGLVALVARLFH